MDILAEYNIYIWNCKILQVLFISISYSLDYRQLFKTQAWNV